MAAVNPAKKLIEFRERAKLSRNRLAVLAGFKRGTSLQYYEMPTNWAGRLFPVEFVARIAPALIGAGSPAITSKEIWALAEAKGSVIVAPDALVIIPVLEWSALSSGRAALKTAAPVGFVQATGLALKDYIAVVATGDLAAGQVPRGSHLLVDPDDTELRDGRRYVIVWEESAVMRRYFSNPARFESEAIPAEPALYPTAPVEIIGRVVRAVIDF